MSKLLIIRRRTLLALGFTLLVATTLSSPSAAQTDYALRIVQGADVDTLDPPVSRSRPNEVVLRNVFNTLVKWKDPSLSELVGDLAESWSQSDDGLTWTFRLRGDVNFHDGTHFDAEAVKFNLDRIVDPALGSPNAAQFAAISQIEVVNPLTIEITTTDPSPVLLENLAEVYASMGSPTAIMENPGAYSRNPVGTGPYRFTEWIPGEQLVLERNPEYYGMPGKPATMTFRPVPEGSARAIELQTGNADIALNLAPESSEEIKQNASTELVVAPSSFQISFELNTANQPFDDPRVRLALNYAIDREAIIKTILQGFGRVPEGIFPEGVQGRSRQTAYPYDPEKARQLIAEVFPDGYDGTVVIWTSDGRYMKDKTVAEVVQGYLNDIGFKTEFKVWEWAAYQKTLYNPQEGGTGRGSNDASMWLLGSSVTSADWRLRRKFYSTDASNLTGYNDARIDELLDKAAVDLNNDTRMGYYGEIQRIVWNEAPNSLVLFDQVQLMGIAKGITGFEIYSNELVRLDQVEKQ